MFLDRRLKPISNTKQVNPFSGIQEIAVVALYSKSFFRLEEKVLSSVCGGGFTPQKS